MLDTPDLLRAGEIVNNKSRVLVEKLFEGDTLHAEFDAQPGKKTGSLALSKLVVKQAKKNL